MQSVAPKPKIFLWLHICSQVHRNWVKVNERFCGDSFCSATRGKQCIVITITVAISILLIAPRIVFIPGDSRAHALHNCTSVSPTERLRLARVPACQEESLTSFSPTVSFSGQAMYSTMLWRRFPSPSVTPNELLELLTAHTGGYYVLPAEPNDEVFSGIYLGDR